MSRTYIAIDLKSYYASVECVLRGLDPLTTHLVVADISRTEKTICLAVSPSLKAYGIPGRARLFEVVQRVNQVNAMRLKAAPEQKFTGDSYDSAILQINPSLELCYIVAQPRMRTYMEVSTQIFNIYLKYVSSEDIHVYSIDECFIDVTDYLKLHQMSAHELCKCMIQDVLDTTGITATGGIGTNMYLAKVAMDVMAKKCRADKDGVRIAELDERTYRRELWAHEPITDFWRVGAGIAKKLAEKQIFTMGDIARVSIGLPPTDTLDEKEHHFLPDGRVDHPDYFFNEGLLYKMFGVNAELLIDHAWGYEPTTIDLVKAYVPENNSLSTGQVLTCPYEYAKAEIVVREMADALALDLVSKALVADQVVLTIGYDVENQDYAGTMVEDHYGRKIPKSAHGSKNLGKFCSLSSVIVEKVMELYREITDPTLYIRRLTVVANHVIPEAMAKDESTEDIYEVGEQLNLFTDYEKRAEQRAREKEKEEQEKSLQKAILSIHGKFGKNALLKGTDFLDGATMRERNGQVGGHKG